MTTLSIDGMLAQRARLAPTREALVGGGRRLDWAQADAECTRLAGWLREKGIATGDRIAILARNSVEAALSVFAASRAGAIAVVLNWRLAADEIAWILQDCGARALIHDAAFAPLAEQADIEVRLSLDGKAPGPVYADAIADRNTGSTELPAPRAVGEIAVILYTSGTTGSPKGAMLTHRNFLWAAHGVTSTIEWIEDHRFLLVAPMFHVGGLMPLLTSVQKGNAVVFLADFDPVAVWRTIGGERITNAMLVPIMLQALDMAAAKMPVDASSLVNFSCGASPVPAAMIHRWAERGVPIQQVYGLTEVTGAAAYWTPAMGMAGAGSQGRAVFLTELQVIDPDTRRPVPSGTRGEVVTRGPNVFAGYWNNEEATRAAIGVDGWFATGDVGYLDEAGFLRIVDRLKDLMISGGENVYPAEIEAVLATHPSVAEAAVIGRADERWGEVPVAYVVARAGEAVDGALLIDLCRERLAGFKCPREIVFVDALPRNGAGKVLKRMLPSSRALMA